MLMLPRYYGMLMNYANLFFEKNGRIFQNFKKYIILCWCYQGTMVCRWIMLLCSLKKMNVYFKISNFQKILNFMLMLPRYYGMLMNYATMHFLFGDIFKKKSFSRCKMCFFTKNQTSIYQLLWSNYICFSWLTNESNFHGSCLWTLL
jgi:hypothetical protein